MLKYLKILSLKYRRERGDMIELYKTLNGRYEEDCIPSLIKRTDDRTRGNSFKLVMGKSRKDIRRYYFVIRVTNNWNGLPDKVVCAGSLEEFKKLLDFEWRDEMYIT